MNVYSTLGWNLVGHKVKKKYKIYLNIKRKGGTRLQ